MTSNNMMAIQALTNGKTDTELLNAMVFALIDNDKDLIQILRNSFARNLSTDIDRKTGANVEVLAAIVECIRNRAAVKPAGEN